MEEAPAEPVNHAPTDGALPAKATPPAPQRPSPEIIAGRLGLLMEIERRASQLRRARQRRWFIAIPAAIIVVLIALVLGKAVSLWRRL